MTSKKKAKNSITEIDSLPLVMAPVDVARVLGVSKNTVYEVLHSKGFPAIKIGKQYRVQRDKFFQWLDEMGRVEMAA